MLVWVLTPCLTSLAGLLKVSMTGWGALGCQHRLSCSHWVWSGAGKDFSLGDKSIGIRSAGKTSESQLAELHKLCWFTHQNHCQKPSSSWEETIAQKCEAVSNNVISGLRRKDSYRQMNCVYRTMNNDNNPRGRKAFEVPGFVLQKRWYQILLTCAAKPQTQTQN